MNCANGSQFDLSQYAYRHSVQLVLDDLATGLCKQKTLSREGDPLLSRMDQLRALAKKLQKNKMSTQKNQQSSFCF
ncbi:hypothetical protein [Paraglaciecola aestuariivivens]